MSAVDRLLDVALAEDGYCEKSAEAYKKDKNVIYDKTKGAGKDNITKYWADIFPSYQGEAWCNGFVFWCFMKCFGEETARKMLFETKSSSWNHFYTPDTSDAFKSAKAWYTKPKVGDLIYFKNDVRIHHVGIVRKVTDDYVYTVEGNTSASPDVVPNGGMVRRKSYPIKSTKIAGYGRPNWSLVNQNDGARDIVIVRRVNLRKGPSVLYSSMGKLQKGEVHKWSGKENGNFIYLSDVNGWIHCEYMKPC